MSDFKPDEHAVIFKLVKQLNCIEEIAIVQEKRNLKAKNKQTSNPLEQPKALHLKVKAQQDEEVQQYEGEMCKALKIPAQCLLPPEKMENFTDAEVIRHASGGLALEGIFQTKNMEHMFGKREPVLCIPENVSLARQEHSSVVGEEEFLSPKMERDFQKVIERLGMNLWRSVFVPLMQSGLYCECGLEPEPNYVCATSYIYIPLASCYIRRDQLRLSQSAINALKDIEEAINGHADEQDLGSKCETFFHRFGSHIHFGPIHFGGIYSWKISMTEDDPRKIEKAKQAVSHALNSYEDASCAGYKVDSDFLTTTAQGLVDFSKTSNFQKHIQVSISRTGGPSDAASFLQWKSGVQSSKKTWSVIDRGYQLMPIWTVIKDNHKGEFSAKIASCLSNHYERFTGLTPEKSHKNAIEIAKGFLWYVQFWNVDSAEDHVSASTDLKKELFELTGADNIWENICLSDKNFQTFLKRVVQKYIDTPEEHTQLIRTPMKDLLDPHIFSVKNFPDTIFIMNWIHKYEKEIDFKKFMQDLYKYVENQKATSHLTIADQYKINCLLNRYLIALRNTNNLEEELLMLCIAIDFEYFTENHSFQRPLGYKEIEHMRNQMQGTYNKFMNIRCKCTKRAQAFVLYRGLTSPKNMSLEWKAQRLDFMQEHLQGRLFNAICNIIGHGQPSTQEEWNKIENDLKDYIYGKMDIPWLLKKLDLEKYYPQKMTMMDVRKICLSCLAGKHDFKETQLHLFYLQKLLMLDCNAKYVQCAQSSHLTDGGEDVIDIFPQGNMQKYEQQNQQAIHPMDVQMSVFHCADDFTRQYLYSKLSICQFALPFLVPHPNSDSIEFPLWSFQEIKKKWKKECKRDTPYDKVIKKTKTPIVAFIRLGQSSSSKSQLMNKLISKQEHNIFFHRHLIGSTNDALLMNGVTEIAWYFPSGKEDDPFDHCIAFTNLHGDAKEHNRQVKFLEEISSVIVVVFSDSELDPRGKEVLQQLQKSPKSLICLLADKEKCPPGKGNKISVGLKKRNEAEIIQDISHAIQCLLSFSKKEYSLDTCADVARKHGFVVDEDKTQCKQGKEDAQGLMSLLKAKEVSVWKEEFLPLQGELWKDWCKKYKELKIHNSDLNTEQQPINIESKKREIWNELIKRAFPLNNFMKDFIDCLKSHNQESNMYFLQWLKTYLDDFSISTLSGLQENYYYKLSQIIEKKKGTHTDKTSIKTMEHDLEKLSEEIEISTFGLEHILRELGQIYEASEILPKKDQWFFTLPKIAAALMASGYPIELMDGDAAHVPLKWIRSILDELIKTLGDKKLYVLTVLGIQSTEKSTLLSAMFGLQSAVGAGRGTKGAFMQLIKVDEQLRQELNFDYVLIIDTEGLRAAELPTKTTIDHDKELATFVIGLSNLSLINICGENPSEMQYILQIAIQAFLRILRMKEVPPRPSCVFVHQNVGKITAQENLKKKRHLQDKLDEMTLCVTQQQKCDSTCFRDVVRFDVNTHIHFLAPLSEGDSPMALPNPSYSQNIQQLRQDILETAKQEEKQNILCISTFKTQINDLWHALLSKDPGHKTLEAKYSEWMWELRKRMLTLQSKIIYQIHNHGLKEWEFPQDPEPELIYDGILKELKAFFDDKKNKEVKALCKVDKIIERLDFLKKDLIREVKKNADKFIAFEKKRKKYEDKMLAEVGNLASSLEGKNITDRKLRTSFDNLWNPLIDEVKGEVKKDYTFEKPNINNDLEKEFLEMFKDKKNIRSTIKESYRWENLVEEFSKYISNKSKMVVVHQKLSKADVETIQHTTDVLERKLEEFLHNKEQKRMDYQPVYFGEIVEMLTTEIDEGLENFKFRRQYTLYASLFFCHKAAKRFENMFEVCRAANDMVDFLLKKNNEFWEICKMFCNGTMEDFLCVKLKEAIKEGVYDKSSIDLASKVKYKHQALNRNKSKLDFYLLKSLAEKEIFSEYMYYIRDPKSAVGDFIKECVGQYCDDNRNVVSEILNINLDYFKNITLKAINNTSAILVRGKKDGVEEWLDTFCSQLGSEVKLSRDDLWSVTYLNITDVESLKEAMKQALETVVQKIDLTDLKANVSRIILDHFSGCWKKCPFCCAVCTKTICKHDGEHSATCHRPQALNGWHYRKTNQFVVKFCESLVKTNINFRIPVDRSIPYKIFEQAGNPFSTWTITPSKPELSYWKWVTHHFQNDLVKHYKYKFTELGTIPAQWGTINKEEAIEELRKYLKKENFDNMVNGNL